MGDNQIEATRSRRRALLMAALLLSTIAIGAGERSVAAEPAGKPAPCIENDPSPYCVRNFDHATVEGPTAIVPGQTVTVVFAPSIPKCRPLRAAEFPAPCWNFASLSATQGQAGGEPLITPVTCNIVGNQPPFFCQFTVPTGSAPPTWMKWSASVSYFEPGTNDFLQEIYGTPPNHQNVLRKNALAEQAVYYGTVSADFRYDIDGGMVSFQSKSTDIQNRTLFESWDFGDGTTGVGANPAHRYTRSGTYRVTLTAVNTDGEQNSITRSVQVVAEPLAIADVVIDPSPLEVGEPGTVGFTVVNYGDEPVTNIVPVVTFDPADNVAVTDDSPLGAFGLAAGESKAIELPVDPLQAGETFVHIGATGLLDGVATDATSASLAFDVAGNPGLDIQLEGQVIEIGKSFTVRLTITNPTDDAIDGISWTGPNGLVVESGDNPAAAEPNVSYVSGPDAALPTSLEPGASASVSYVFNAPTVGASVFTSTANGTARTTGEAVTTVQAMSVLAVANWSEQVRDQVAVEGLVQILGAMVDGRGQLANASMSQVIAALGFDPPTQSALNGAAQAGISDPSLRRLAAAAATSAPTSSEPGFVRSITDSYVEGLAEGMDGFGRSGGETLANIYAAVEDPVQRRAIAEGLWSSAKQLPSSTLENAGYLGQAWLAAHTVEGLQTVRESASATTTAVTSAMGEAIVGLGPVLADYGRQALTNPAQARRDLAKFSGSLMWTGSEAGMAAALGEAGTAAVVKLAAPVARTGLSVFTAGGRVEEAIVATTMVAEDAAESMVLRQAQAAQVMDNYQALPEGMVIDVATVTGKGGLLAEDSAGLQSTISKANEKFGTEFMVSMRTSEPLSVGLDGIAKPEFIKPKAVSVLDMMLGADPARAGRVAIFNPTPLADATIANLEAANPGFAAKYFDRLTSQQKIWADWNKPGNPLRTLTEAGARYADDGGITVLSARPNAPVPYGMQYLEQLTEPEFLLAKGIDPADVPAIRDQIMRSNIQKYKAAPVAVDGTNGMVHIDDAVANKPYLSDGDIQAVTPKDGVYPRGVSRGEVTTFFNAEFKKLKRFPFHGWSDAAFDLPSDYYAAAIPFQLGNANPATAINAATKVAGRLELLENLARSKAAALTAAGDGYAAGKILDRLAGLEKFKDPITGLYSPRKLLEAFPPGEKTINFTAGDIRVGYGTGGN